MSFDVLEVAIRYGAVGVVNTLANGLLLYCFMTCMTLPSAVSVTLTFLVCMAFQFSANRSFTFRASGRISVQLLRYFAMAGLNYLLTLVVIYALVDMMRRAAITGVVVSTVLTAATGFLLSLVWVFQR